MSPSTTSTCNPSRLATRQSCSSCFGELSKTVTWAPAAARTGACCPPADARQSVGVPLSSGNHAMGTGLPGVSNISNLPRRASATVSVLTVRVHRFPSSTFLFHAARLCDRTSIIETEYPVCWLLERVSGPSQDHWALPVVLTMLSDYWCASDCPSGRRPGPAFLPSPRSIRIFSACCFRRSTTSGRLSARLVVSPMSFSRSNNDSSRSLR